MSRCLPTRPTRPVAKKPDGGCTNINDLDHARLFSTLAGSRVNFLMTYDESPEIKRLIAEYRFHVVLVKMKSTHHTHRNELIITPRPLLPGLTTAKSKGLP